MSTESIVEPSSRTLRMISIPMQRPLLIPGRAPRGTQERVNWIRVRKFLDISAGTRVDKGFLCTLNHLSLQGLPQWKDDAGFYRRASVAIKENGRVVYYPPAPEKVPPLMEGLIAMIDGPRQPYVEHVARVIFSLLAIHPFQDGNGRTGRALSTYLLVEAGFRERSASTLEDFFDLNSSRYYRTLNQAHRGDVAPWLGLFAEAVDEVMVRP